MKYLFSFCALFLLINLHSQTLQSIESVEYDPTQNRFLVSNGNSIIARNEDGSLSYFGNGAANYGMEVMGNTLFAIHNSSIKGFDLTTEEEVMNISIPGASFLNGMTNDGTENLYVTDFGAKKIYKINVADFSNPTSEVIVSNTSTTPNGIVYDGANNRLIFVNWGNNAPIKAVDLSDNSVSTITTTSYSNIDGIDEDNDGNYYISYWSTGTRISKFDSDFAESPVEIEIDGLSSPADICYAKEIDTLAIPHSGNQLAFIGFESITDLENLQLTKDFQMNVSPNPVTDQAIFSFKIPKEGHAIINILSVDGKLIKTIFNEQLADGRHEILIDGDLLLNGINFIQLQINGSNQIIKILK